MAGIVHEFRKLQRTQRVLNQRINALGIQIDPANNAVVIGGGRKLELQDADGNLLITLGANGLTATDNGRIGDGALAHPSQPVAVFADTDSTDLTVSGDDMAIGSVTVPDGFTAAAITVAVNIGDSRSAATDFPFYGQSWAQIGGGSSWAMASAVIANGCPGSSSASIAITSGAYWTGLSAGAVIDFGAWAAVDDTSGWLSGGANAHSYLLAAFYR